MIESGVLDDTTKVELLEGYVVDKMPRNPPHDGTIQIVRDSLAASLPPHWTLRIQSAVTLLDSEPEPDLALVRGHSRSYLTHHPGPAEIGLLVEVAEASLDRERLEKSRIYARAAIPVYWIVNLVDRRLEVFTDPSGPEAMPRYAQQLNFGPSENVPLVLDGTTVPTMTVATLLP
jgi:Uma2 family endonuclease